MARLSIDWINGEGHPFEMGDPRVERVSLVKIVLDARFGHITFEQFNARLIAITEEAPMRGAKLARLAVDYGVL